MTNLPDDPIEVSVDHATVAPTAGGGPPPAGGRLPWLFAGAAALAGVAAVAILANTWRGPNVGASPTAPGTAIAACTTEMLDASVGQWEGAAGHRIGTLTLANKSASACALPAGLQLSLVDRNGHDLIAGKASSLQAIEIAAQTGVQTMVQTGNYCGPTAQEPAAIVLTFANLRLIVRPATGDTSSGVPPCMGENGPTDDITIQPWGLPQG